MLRQPPAASAPSSPRAIRSALSRTAIVVGALASLVIASPRAEAQTTTATARSWEFRVSSGAFVPTGALRASVKTANLTAAQLSWAVRPTLALTATAGWARSRDVAAIDAPKLDVFTIDLGVEARGTPWRAGRAVTVSPFMGAGAGAQRYDYRTLDVNATNNAGGYATVGGELGMGRVGVRLEARDYVVGFKPLRGVGASATRSNVVLMLAMRFNRARRTAAN